MTVSDKCVGLIRTSSSDLVTHSALKVRGLLMSSSTPRVQASPVGTSGSRGLRLRLKPADQRFGSVQGAWWPRSTQLTTELPLLLAALSSRLGRVDRVVYDENAWAPAPLHLRFRSSEVVLDSSADQSINTISLIREHAESLVLLVVPPYTNPTRAYTAVMTAAKPDDVSTHRRTARDREAGGRGSPFRTDGAPALGIRRRSIAPPATSARRIGRDSGSSAGAKCSVTTNSKPCATSSAGFDGTAQNRLRSSAPWKRRQRRVAASVLGQECWWRQPMFAGMALLGPRMLTEAEVKTRKSPPLPRTSPPVTTVARPKSRLCEPRRRGHFLGCRRICSLVPQQLSQRRHAKADLRGT